MQQKTAAVLHDRLEPQQSALTDAHLVTAAAAAAATFHFLFHRPTFLGVTRG